MRKNILICLSMTREELARLSEEGPRRDIVALAEYLRAPILFRGNSASRKGLRGKILGPQIRHAWIAAGDPRKPKVIFADGEHVGLPLAAALFLRRRRKTRLVVLGHLVDKGWKRRLLWIATRLVPRGTLVLHSTVQAARVGGDVGSGWDVETLPYQVDTAFWANDESEADGRPLLVSAGSENRDYQTLADAVRGLDIDVRIAAGSHWARLSATATNLPGNVEFIRETLPFDALRDLYRRAFAVVVPLFPGTNQAGVTTILEGMSMSLPVVVSATEGQREVVTGPMATSDSFGSHPDITRGPQVLGLDGSNEATGIYVTPNDPVALRKAIVCLLNDRVQAAAIGRAGRKSSEARFGVDAFVQRFARVLTGGPEEARTPSRASVPTP